MTNENYTEEDAKRVMEEYKEQSRKFQKQYEILLGKGMEIAVERGLEMDIRPSEENSSEMIQIYNIDGKTYKLSLGLERRLDEDKFYEVIVCLAKEKFPELYGKYASELGKMDKIEVELNKISNYFENLGDE